MVIRSARPTSQAFIKLFLLAILLCAISAPAQQLTSPDKNLALTFGLTKQGQPEYSLTYKGKVVLKPSLMGFELLKAKPLTTGFSVVKQDTSTFDETWKPVWGQESEIRNHYNELAVTLKQESTDRTMIVRFRLFDDGLGFRYEFPEQEDLKAFIVKDELTQFALSGDNKAWWLPGDLDTEEYSTVTSNLSEVRAKFKGGVSDNASQHPLPPTGMQTPLMMKSKDGLYINIHEAALINYSAMNVMLDDKQLHSDHLPHARRARQQSLPAGSLRHPMANSRGQRQGGRHPAVALDPEPQRAD